MSYDMCRKECIEIYAPFYFKTIIMTIEEALEECKRRFPIGTRFKAIWGDAKTISYITYTVNETSIGSITCNGINHSNGEGYFYIDGKFATIISLPKEVELNYEIC